jgi:hypothetical protein
MTRRLEPALARCFLVRRETQVLGKLEAVPVCLIVARDEKQAAGWIPAAFLGDGFLVAPCFQITELGLVWSDNGRGYVIPLIEGTGNGSNAKP